MLRYSVVVTIDAETTATPYAEPVDLDELRHHLREADPGVLVAVLAQLTGDASVIDRFGPAISHVPDPPERAGVTDRTPRRRSWRPLSRRWTRPGSGTTADDPELFKRLLPLALGSDVDDEFVPLLLEQGGFQLPQPTLPRTVPIRRR